MEFNKKLKLVGAVITNEKMKKLMEIVEKHTKKKEILDITFDDESGISNLSIDNFSSYNFDNRLINRMRFYIMSDYKNEYYNKVTFSYYKDFYMAEIEYSSDDRENFLKIQDDIENWVISVTSRKWISFFHKWFIYLPVFILIFLFFYFSIMKFIKNISDSNLFLSFIFLLPLFIELITYSIVKLLRIAFPNTEIDIGLNKNKKNRNLLWVFLTLVAIPIIINILF